MLALPAEGSRSGPDLHQEVVSLFEALPVEERVDVGGEALDAGAADESGDEAPAGDHVDLGQFLGQTLRVVEHGQWVAEQDDLGGLGVAGEDGCLEVHSSTEAGGRVVVLVEHETVEPDFLAVLILVEVFVVLARADHGVEIAVGEGEANGLVGAVSDVLLGIVGVGPLGKPHQEHWRSFSYDVIQGEVW